MTVGNDGSNSFQSSIGRTQMLPDRISSCGTSVCSRPEQSGRARDSCTPSTSQTSCDVVGLRLNSDFLCGVLSRSPPTSWRASTFCLHPQLFSLCLSCQNSCWLVSWSTITGHRPAYTLRKYYVTGIYFGIRRFTTINHIHGQTIIVM